MWCTVALLYAGVVLHAGTAVCRGATRFLRCTRRCGVHGDGVHAGTLVYTRAVVHAGVVVYTGAVVHAAAVVYTGTVVCTVAVVHAGSEVHTRREMANVISLTLD